MNITHKKAIDHKNDSILKLVVISDMHVWDEENNNEVGSWLKMGQPENLPNQHPITGLLELIKTQKIKANYLLCCGDLADKANPKALMYAWDQVIKLKKAISAKQVFATSGNHDVDSRYKYNDYDAKGTLQSLVPPFPVKREPLNDKYWAKNYVIIDNHNCRFVILNSSAYHGQVSDKTPPEYLHGRVSPRTISSLERDLIRLNGNTKIVNILLCHHHPHKHNDIVLDDYSEMKDGSRLIDLLEGGKYGRWVIIHGHKHHPRLCYAAGGSSAPIIFSAGSLCAKLYAEQQARARNQFYVIEFPYGNFSNLGLGIAGRFWSWDWIPGEGWQVADKRSGLPGLGGFGYRAEISVEAQNIHKLLVKNKPILDWEYILEKIPKLEFLSPKDINLLVETLENKHKLKIQISNNGAIKQIGK